ncbi:MAG: translation elongation factor-like protein [Chloroflexi bacterium]|nr:translation elongation factor-like protein [Chloroflexota bacterium]
MPEKHIGKVSHYFDRIGVAALNLTGEALEEGDIIHIKGHTTDLTQRVDSMQIDHQIVHRAEVGQDVAVRVVQPVRQHDMIYKVTP